jgi:hypothetical protein
MDKCKMEVKTLSMITASFWSLASLMGDWHPTIGDPSFMGWFTVASYFACAAITLSTAIKNQNAGKNSFLFWSIITVLMVLFGINKQLDLQSLLTEIGRQIARHQGWMDQRRSVQFWFIAFLGTLAIASFLLFIRIMRDALRRCMLAFVGLFFLISFIMIRAVSFHHFYQMLGFSILSVKINWIIELSGIYIIIVAAIIDIYRVKKTMFVFKY